MVHLGGEALVVEEQRRVGEADRDLRDVLHLHEHVDRTVEIRRDRRVVVGDRRPPLGRAGELAELGDALGRASQDQDVVGHERLVAVGVDDPLLAPADGDDTHADLDRQLDVGERPVRERRVLSHAHPVRDLLGLPRGRRRARQGCRAGATRRADTSTAAFAIRSIEAMTCSTLDISSASRGERAASTQISYISCTRSLRRSSSSRDLVGHALVGEEERGVRQVDHELGGVLGLREHGLEVARWLVGFCHGYERPRITRDTMNDGCPEEVGRRRHQRHAVVVGIPPEPVGRQRGGVRDDRGERRREDPGEEEEPDHLCGPGRPQVEDRGEDVGGEPEHEERRDRDQEDHGDVLGDRSQRDAATGRRGRGEASSTRGPRGSRRAIPRATAAAARR